MSEDPVEDYHKIYQRIKALDIGEAKARGLEWGEDIIAGAPYARINLSLDDMTSKSLEELDAYFKHQLIDQLAKKGDPAGSLFNTLLNNFENRVAFRGFSKKLKNPKNTWSSYRRVLKNIRKYGFDKPAIAPIPIYPSWVGDLSTALSFAGLHSGSSGRNDVGFILMYKGEDSITFDPWDYKEYGVRFDQEKIKSNPDLRT
jgi:hypothetical protein